MDSRIPGWAGRVLTLAETTGELGVMTLLLIAVYRMVSPGKPASSTLVDIHSASVPRRFVMHCG